MLYTAGPLLCMTRYDFDLEPIISPSHTVKRFVRFTTFGLVLLVVASLILGLIGKFEQYINGYEMQLAALMLFSWVCVTWYVYGIRVHGFYSIVKALDDIWRRIEKTSIEVPVIF